MIRRLLWCCIWLSVVSSQWLVVSGQTPMTAPASNSPSPVSNLPSDLPCLSSESDCLRRLGDLAVSHHLEIRTLDQAIALGRKKQWTTWLNADGLNPLAMGLRIVRNIAGGGDRAALKLANLKRRRAEVETSLRQAVTLAVADYEAAERRAQMARAKLAAHEAKLKFLEVTYKLGEGETETMLTLWRQREEMQAQVVTVEAETITQRLRLELLTHPAPRRP